MSEIRTEGYRRRPPHRWAQGTGALVLVGTLAACGGSGSDKGSTAPAPYSSTGVTAPVSSESPQPSRSPDASGPYFGMTADQVPYPGRIDLPIPGPDAQECSPYGFDNPLPPIMRVINHKRTMVVITDARDSYPPAPGCDPNAEAGAYLYSGASLDTPEVLEHGKPAAIPDGQVVRVLKYASGELACNTRHDPGGESVWLKLTDGHVTGWTAEINTEQGMTAQQLADYNVPVEHFSQQIVAGVEGGC